MLYKFGEKLPKYLKWSVGMQFETRYGNILTVASIVNNTDITYTCNVCHKDVELFPTPLRGNKDLLKRGGCGCGCSMKTNWTDKQLTIMARRLVESSGYEFIGLVNIKNKTKAKIHLRCQKHNEDSYPTLANSLIKGKVSCNSCSSENTGLLNSKPNDYNTLLNICRSFELPYTLVEKSDLNTGSQNSKVKVFCPICSEDEYSKNGLSDGWFETTKSHLIEGKTCCRCHKGHRLNKEQIEFKLQKFAELDGECFIGMKYWSGNIEGSIAEMSCSDDSHNSYQIEVEKYLHKSVRCPLCSGADKRYSYINYISDNELPVFLKFGIASDTSVRLSNLRKNNKGWSIDNLSCFVFDTQRECIKAETEVKKLYRTKYVTKIEFPDGYTETAPISDYDNIVNVFMKHGGRKEDLI